MYWFKIDSPKMSTVISQKVDNIQEVHCNTHIETLSDNKFCYVEMKIIFKREQSNERNEGRYLVHLDVNKLKEFQNCCIYNESEIYNSIYKRSEKEGYYYHEFYIKDFTSNDPFLQNIFDKIEDDMKKFYR